MRAMQATLLAFALVTAPALVRAQAASETQIDQTYRDIETTLGVVPTFMREFPPEALPGAWAAMKGLNLNPNTALDGRTKELIGLAVAAAIPCRYCSYFHNRAAKANGATEDQVREAVAKAGLTGHWAAYLASGLVDATTYRRDVDRFFRHLERTARLPAEAQPGLREAPADPSRRSPPGKLGQGTATGKTPPELAMTASPEETYRDIETTLGSVPVVLREYPKDAVSGIWNETKALEFGPDAALTKKEKSLIGLAVSAGAKCDLCVYYQTKAARLHGATDQEMREAVAMAASTQHWSAYLNGMRMDESEFQRQTDQIMDRMKGKTGQPGR